jgi:hypothetical protein
MRTGFDLTKLASRAFNALRLRLVRGHNARAAAVSARDIDLARERSWAAERAKVRKAAK